MEYPSVGWYCAWQPDINFRVLISTWKTRKQTQGGDVGACAYLEVVPGVRWAEVRRDGHRGKVASSGTYSYGHLKLTQVGRRGETLVER